MAIVDDILIKNYQEIHAAKKYGFTSSAFKEQIQACINEIKPKVILEYGCGRSSLIEELIYDGEYYRYDPAIPEFSDVPVEKADFVINTDVLEHIPEKDLADVVGKIKGISNRVFFNIATDYANEILPNGENAHCTVWPSEKWLSFLMKFFSESEVVYSSEKKECIIITWHSPGTSSLIRDIQLLKVRANKKNDHIFKRMERSVRKIRNKIIGKG